LYCLHGIANTQPSLSMSSFCLVMIFLFAVMIRRFLLCVRYPTLKNLGAIVQQRESIFEHRILRGRLLLLLLGLIPMHASDATHAHLCGSSTVVTNAMQCNEVHKHILPVDSSSCVPAPPSYKHWCSLPRDVSCEATKSEAVLGLYSHFQSSHCPNFLPRLLQQTFSFESLDKMHRCMIAVLLIPMEALDIHHKADWLMTRSL
jgi:hypothetical protein